jgi:Ca2+-binding RTX toxin-like protein
MAASPDLAHGLETPLQATARAFAGRLRPPEPPRARNVSGRVRTKGRKMAIINGTPGADELRGTNRDDLIRGFGGIDEIDGRDGDDEISGGSRGDDIVAGDGDDLVLGNRGNDDIAGDSGNDSVDGGDGNDEIDGDNGRDTLFGGRGNDDLAGNNGGDALDGGRGNDLLEGGTGNDELAGGGGSDTFEFDPGDGRDTIVDWTPGTDLIDLVDFDYDRFRDVMRDAFNEGGNVVFNLDGTDITVLDVAKSDFNASDFIL